MTNFVPSIAPISVLAFLTDVGGEATIKTSFGSVNVQRINGSLRIENSNGPVRRP